jgi:transposase-like protein
LAAGQLKPPLQQLFLAPDPATGLRRGRARIARLRAPYPAAVECLEKDLEECRTCLLFPKEHQGRLRTTNLLERTFEESRRRTKVIALFPTARACLSLIYASLITAAQQCRGIPMTPISSAP